MSGRFRLQWQAAHFPAEPDRDDLQCVFQPGSVRAGVRGPPQGGGVRRGGRPQDPGQASAQRHRLPENVLQVRHILRDFKFEMF